MPDVTWHPVDETPPRADEYWVKQAARTETIIGLWMQGLWFYPYGHPMKGVTHYAEIELPEPPEEQNA